MNRSIPLKVHITVAKEDRQKDIVGTQEAAQCII